jgi:hypothetical protein
MPAIGAINTITNLNPPIKDVTRPNDVTVNRAEWGDLVQKHTSTKALDPLVLECAGLQAGNTLLFINCDDPKVKQLVKRGDISDLPPDAVKTYPLPDHDLHNGQNLELSDATALSLGLTKGCEFAVLQRDPAGNLSAKPTFVELEGNGASFDLWQRPGGVHVGDVALQTPAYQYQRPHYGRTSSTEYLFNRARDATPATVYLDKVKLFLDEKTGKVTLTADHAMTGKTTLRLKNITTQETFQVKDEEGDGNAVLEGINLRPGDRYQIWTIDRNGVEEEVVNATFMPVSTSPLALQCSEKSG